VINARIFYAVKVSKMIELCFHDRLEIFSLFWKKVTCYINTQIKSGNNDECYAFPEKLFSLMARRKVENWSFLFV
jgi:hypothetical protein